MRQEAKQPMATIPPLILLLLFLASSLFVFSGNPLPLSFIFTPAMGLVTGQPLHNTIHTHTVTVRLVFVTVKLSAAECSRSGLNQKTVNFVLVLIENTLQHVPHKGKRISESH